MGGRHYRVMTSAANLTKVVFAWPSPYRRKIFIAIQLALIEITFKKYITEIFFEFFKIILKLKYCNEYWTIKKIINMVLLTYRWFHINVTSSHYHYTIAIYPILFNFLNSQKVLNLFLLDDQDKFHRVNSLEMVNGYYKIIIYDVYVY